MEIWTSYILPILSGLITAIPLVIKLVEYVRKAVKEKNWSKLIDLIMGYMKQAEEKFDNGADRKEWVMAMIEATASTINYDVDMLVVSELIDSLCEMSKIVNAPSEEVISEVILEDAEITVEYDGDHFDVQVTE